MCIRDSPWTIARLQVTYPISPAHWTCPQRPAPDSSCSHSIIKEGNVSSLMQALNVSISEYKMAYQFKTVVIASVIGATLAGKECCGAEEVVADGVTDEATSGLVA